MQIVRDLAGFSMGQSDNIRRAMSKKKKSLMETYRSLFMYGGTDDKGRQIDGAIKRGVPEATAAKIFDDVAGFAGYAFNKSHAACYALVGYWTAYLKYYYPTEFMAAMLNSFRFDLGKASYYISCCSQMGLKVLPPDINMSREKFTTEGDRTIRIGLSVIKNVGERAVLDIVSDRDANGRYKSFEDFITRAAKIGIKRNVAEALILASALDFSGLNRAQMVACVQTELDKLTSSVGNNIEGQLSLFDLGGADTAGASVFVPDIPEYPDDVKLGYEKEMVGIYLSGNPLAAYKDTISRLVTFDMAEASDVAELTGMESMDDNREVAMAGLITSKKTGYTKRKTMMATIVCEDLTGSFEVMLYGKSFDEFNRVTEKNKPYLFIGRRQVREGNGISMFVDACYPLTNDEAQINSIMSNRAYLTAVKESGRKKIRNEQIQPSSEPVEVMSDMPEEIVTDDGQASDEGKRNVLRIVFEGSPDSAGFNRLLNFLAYFHGNMTVEVEFASDGSVTMLDNVCAIDPDESVIRKLCDIVGEDNVRFL